MSYNSVQKGVVARNGLATTYLTEGTTRGKKCVVLKCLIIQVALQHNFWTMPRKAKYTKNKDFEKPIEWASKYLLTVNHRELTALLMIVHEILTDYPILAYKCAVEIGAKGNLHAHMFIAYKRSIRRDTLINAYSKYGVDNCKVTPGTEATVIDYIGNEDKEVSKGCQVVSDYTTIYGNLDITQGVRSDINDTDKSLWDIKDAIDNGATLRDLYDGYFPVMVRFSGGVRGYYELHREQEFAEKIERVVKSKEQQESERIQMEREVNLKEYEVLSRILDKKLGIVNDN